MKEVSIKITEEQRIMLTMFILMTTKYRQGEIKANIELGNELELENLKKNAQWWIDCDKALNEIKEILDSSY